MKAQRQLGFTIVELLVVITIIGLLMALLLPAVGAARRSAIQSQCQNNVRQIGQASLVYASEKGYFPGFISEMRVNYQNNNIIVPWMVQLLPNLQRNDLYDAIQRGVDGGAGTFDSATYLDLAVCPADVPDAKNRPYLSYVVNMGVWDPDVQATVSDGSGWRDAKANGVCHNLVGTSANYGNAAGLSRTAKRKLQQSAASVQVTLDYISSNDGTSTTMLLTENIDAGFWFTDRFDDQGQFGVVWSEPVGNQLRINENKGFGSEVGVEMKFARPSSEHNGIVIVAFCDGHVANLSEQIDPTVYGRLMSSNGPETDVDPHPLSVQTPAWQVVPLTDVDIQ